MVRDMELIRKILLSVQAGDLRGESTITTTTL